VEGKGGQAFEGGWAVWAWVGVVEYGVVAGFARGVGAVGGVVRTVPMVLPFGGSFLKNVLALGTEDVIAETEVLVEN
jgi:hypothetical protein